MLNVEVELSTHQCDKPSRLEESFRKFTVLSVNIHFDVFYWLYTFKPIIRRMRLSAILISSVAVIGSQLVNAFTSQRTAVQRWSPNLFVTMAESGVPPIASNPTDVEDVDIPTNLPSNIGMDYVPLATMLASGQLAEADQFTRDALIVLSGAKAKGRNFVYWTEVKNIPFTDLATIERLWTGFSGGKFGYSVQKVIQTLLADRWFLPFSSSFSTLIVFQKKWKQCKGDFEAFCRKIGWTTKDGEVERKKRWFGASEFIYDVKKAPEGHLPLTSALRGTSLIKQLLNHPVWDTDDWKNESFRK